MEADKNSIRKLALLVLDDENGISTEAFKHLSTLLVLTNNEDIIGATDVTEDRAYIGEDYAEEELAKL